MYISIPEGNFLVNDELCGSWNGWGESILL